MRTKKALAWLALWVITGFGVAQAQPSGAARDNSAACVECHDDEDLPDMSRSAHSPIKPGGGAEVSASRTPTCIGCHGPSQAHLKKPAGAKEQPAPDVVFGKKTQLDASGRSTVCQTCHEGDSKRHLWAGSAHQAADVACNTCHKVHTNHDKALAKSQQAELCYACHKEQRIQVGRPSHHPIPEGKMTCSDCHNVHGSAGPKLASRDSTNATCYTCHAEKRGPFVHAHEPVTEDCASCHNPHGSTVAAMLKTRAPMLCQQCHTPHATGNLGALAGQSGVTTPAVPGQIPAQINSNTSGKNVINLWQGRSCMNCHTQVHGSNNPSATNPTPQFLFR